MVTDLAPCKDVDGSEARSKPTELPRKGFQRTTPGAGANAGGSLPMDSKAGPVARRADAAWTSSIPEFDKNERVRLDASVDRFIQPVRLLNKRCPSG